MSATGHRKRVGSIGNGGGTMLLAPLPREQLPLENNDVRVVQAWQTTLEAWLTKHISAEVTVMSTMDEMQGTGFILSPNSFHEEKLLDRIYEKVPELKGPWEIRMSPDGRSVMMCREARANRFSWREKAWRLLPPFLVFCVVLYFLYVVVWTRL